MQAASRTSGTIEVAGLSAPVTIVRDDRDIPHIRAVDDRDLYFAQGFTEASDRLFQMEILRRFVFGRLAEVFGPSALASDESARVANVAAIVDRQWSAMRPADRDALQAFSDGVNAAMRQQPLPVEFRILLYRPQPWRPQDTLGAGMATVLDLIDSWDDVIRRDRVARQPGAAPVRDLYTITDPAYDSPIAPPRPAAVSPLPPRLAGVAAANAPAAARSDDSPATGSNEFAIGAQRSRDGRALLANDPHLRLAIPGIWYLIDLHSNDLHAAGASLAGTPGVILGHNDDVAWGATNGAVTTESVYRDSLAHAQVRKETFHVRFGRDVNVEYYRTRHGFVAQPRGSSGFAVDWNADRIPRTPLDAFNGLDRARSIGQALAALRSYPGPPQNFALADRSGAVAYHLAGLIPDDPVWGLRAHYSRDPSYSYLAFDALPHVAPSRSALLFTANNRIYGAGYPYRLSPNFSAPYRAARISTLLEIRKRLGIADLAAFQRDTLSFPERDLARATVAAIDRKRLRSDSQLAPYVGALTAWDGRFDPDSHGAAVAWQLRVAATKNVADYNARGSSDAYLASANNAAMMLLLRILRERPHGWWPRSDYDDLLVRSLRDAVRAGGTRLLLPWREFAAVRVRHPLSSLGFAFLNGATLPGDGDNYGLHVQTQTASQSFRAVWDVGNWDAGGIVIPSGESGQPASKHYTDQSATWIAQKLVPLPFSDGAVRAAARQILILRSPPQIRAASP